MEDSLSEAHLIRAFLSAVEQFEITWAQDGYHAVDLILGENWDLVITDLNLPGTDGFEVIRMVKSKSAAIPVIATTGYTHERYRDQALEAGCDAVLVKPLDRDELLAEVREVMGLGTGTGQGVRSVIAIGAHPGDVALGCGGTLLRHATAGDDILIFLVSLGEASRSSVEEVADRLGSRLLLAEELVDTPDDPVEIQHLLERVVAELRPRVAYLPSLGESEPGRREAHRIALQALESVRTVMTYHTATTGMRFAPDRLVDISDQMLDKVEVLGIYRELGAARRDLSSRFAMALARYWGRLRDFGEVEPFETIKVDQG